MDDVRRIRLEREEIAWLTTVDAHGQPQTSPVWFVWHDDALHIASEPAAAKVRNLTANPHVAVHLEGAGAGDLVVTMEGTATTTDGVPGGPYADKYADAFARLGTTAADYLARFSVGLSVTPTRWRIFPSS